MNVDAVILACCEVHRMEGRDKGLVELSGRPLIEWSLESVQGQSTPPNNVLISATAIYQTTLAMVLLFCVMSTRSI